MSSRRAAKPQDDRVGRIRRGGRFVPTSLLFFCLVSIPSSDVAEAAGADADGDGVPDVLDNCRTDPNPDQLDHDLDGLGTACDCDFTQDGIVLPDDWAMQSLAFNTAQPLYDQSGDGFVLGDDVFFCFNQTSGPPG